MHYMLYTAHAFNQPLDFDVSSVTSMDTMFYATSLSDCNKAKIASTWSTISWM